MYKKTASILTVLLLILSLLCSCVSNPPEIDITDGTTISEERVYSSPSLTKMTYAETVSLTETTESDADFVIEINQPTVAESITATSQSSVTAATTASTTTTTTAANATTTTATTPSTTAAGSSATSPATTAKPAATTPAAAAKAPALKLSVNTINSWGEGAGATSQFDVVIANNSDKTVSGWTVTLSMGSSAALNDSWNAKITLKNGVLTATPESYNADIEPGNSVTFGMIINQPGTISGKDSSVTVGGVKTTSVNGNNGNNSGNNGGNGNSNNAGTPPPAPRKAVNVPEPSTDDWLYTDGAKIVDASGREVWLTGVNWFGYNTGTNIFDGVWTADLDSSIASIADHGFNLLRIPFSVELIKNWSGGNYPQANFNQATNSYLVGLNSLEIFDHVVDQCRANGLKIMIDIHSAATDAMGHMDADWIGASLTEQDFLNALSWMAARYKNDDTVIAYDLKNEPHGKANENPRVKWDDSTDPDNWRYVAQKAAKAVLNANPNVLILVEGIEIYPKNIKEDPHFTSQNPGDYHSAWWGGNLRGVKDNPVDLGRYQNKLVYSPHDYGPAVYAQPWFQGDYTFESVMSDYWYDSWFYIQKNDIAPLLIGEWGGFMTEPNLKWMTLMRKLIKDNRIHHTFWCYNANSGDTGGLVGHDFTTWDTEKYNFVKEVLWQENGKFVGLDHKIPLGANGITLSDID
jgi:aryl-phospho-beta-D-glucosidase BglC (GH1 family)